MPRTMEERIIEIIYRNKSIKARAIARELGVERSVVNHYLYSTLRNTCVQDDNFEWSIRDEVLAAFAEHPMPTEPAEPIDPPGQTTDQFIEEMDGELQIEDEIEEKTAIDAPVIAITDPLQKLCKYYIECILCEQDNGKEVYAESQWSLKYHDILQWPGANGIETDEGNDLIQRIMTSQSVEGFFGYPVLVKWNGNVKKLAPVFLWDINKETGMVDWSSTPIINSNLVKHYVTRSNEAVAKELIRLEHELGLDEGDNPTVIELVNRLIHIRQWQWREPINPNDINQTPFSNIEGAGIYNKAIILAEEASPYTKGLISELQILSEKTIDECEGTALYDWICNTVRDEHSALEREILQVLPLNAEQKHSIEKALTGDLTVITGPPGTGKSQVVINLLINQIYNSKSVLFSSKNNKAVNVVLERANGLTPIPFVVRLGGQVGNAEITDMLARLLHAETLPVDLQRYKEDEDEYYREIEELDCIKKAIDDFIDVRNELDIKEREVVRYRRSFSDYFRNQEIVDTAALRGKWRVFKEKQRLLKRENNSFFARLFWGTMEPKREQEVLQVLESSRSDFEKTGLRIPSSSTEIKAYDIASADSIMNSYVTAIDSISEYKGLRDTFSAMDPLELLENQFLDQRDVFYDTALQYWESWLKKNRVALSSEDRQTIINYLSGVQLLVAGEEAPPQVRHAFTSIQRRITRYLSAQAVTLLSARNRVPFEPGCFDMVVIDEASQCDIASAIPLLYRAKKAVIIGDMNQLSHISNLTKSRDQDLMRRYGIEEFYWLYSVTSLFSLAQAKASSQNVVRLKEHHRSHSDIIEFSNDEFYGGDLINATKYDSLNLPPREKPGVRWIDVKGRTIRPTRGSAYNDVEAEAVMEELRRLASTDYIGGIGVISPFRAQANRIRGLIEQDEELYEKLKDNNNLEINTVHQFQGDERDVILFSCTISDGTRDGAKIFLKENGNLFNVAITRARALLITIGDKEYCQESGIPYMERFVDYVSKRENEAAVEYNVEPTPEYPAVPNMDQVSDWEVVLYKALYRAGIKTYPQYPVDKYKLDLAYISGEQRLDIEVDGEMYHKTWDGELCYRDQLRNQRLFESGWDVRRFWVYQIRDDIESCVATIKNWIEENED